MNRRERLMATLRGEPVDRPAVSFYELNGLDEDPSLDDPFNIYSHPSWQPLLELTRHKTDRIVMRTVEFSNADPSPLDELTHTETTFAENGSCFTRHTVTISSHELTATTRRDPDVNTVWQIEPLLKNVDDAKAWLSVPAAPCTGQPDIADVLKAEATLGDSGIVMIDTPDPLCLAAQLFDMADYMLFATLEKSLFHQILERFAATLYYQTEAVAQALPGRLWGIFWPEYAAPPFLRPQQFREVVVNYDTALVKAIQSSGGFARIHSHGKLKDILDEIVALGCVALDPIEPPPQGDVELSYVRQKYGEQLVLFGNLEVSDIETLPTAQFEQKVWQALHEGTAGTGRGFVLMPSACPYGRELAPLTLANYEKIIAVVEQF
ncbi:uroporphyrinogen decarboxylase family protein [Chloroflexota bacterium]